METSEARKRHAEATAAAHERRREVAQAALERLMTGADFTDADALLDAFSDLGARLEVA